MPTKNDFMISWQAPEFRHYEKSWGWYVTLLAITIMLVGFFIIQKDIFAAITLALIGTFVILFSRHTPRDVQVELSGKGVKFGNLHFPYKQLKHFWLVYNKSHKTINFHTNTFINNTLIIELENQDPEMIRELLLQHLPEHTETRETFAQRISHKLKF